MRQCRVLLLGKQADLVEAGRSSLALFHADAGENSPLLELLESKSEDSWNASLKAGDLDLVLAACATHSEGVAADALQRQHPGLPFVLLTTPDAKQSLLAQTELAVWDVVSTDELSRLSLVIRNATDCGGMRKEQSHANGELEQAKSLLLKNQKSITVGRLLGSIAHEINNPLEAVTNLLFLAKYSIAEGSDATESLEMAEKEVQRVGNITRQMLSFHRESRVREEIAVTGAMETALSLYEVRLRHAGINVVRQYRNVGCVIAYPGELRQVFSNLIANSVDAMPSGGHLTVRVQERHGVVPGLCITIADSGTGMPRAVSQHVGDLFFTTKGETGTGLGMWVTKQLITKNGGSIQVYSSARAGSSGTVFRLVFPEPYARLEPLAVHAQRKEETVAATEPELVSSSLVDSSLDWNEDTGPAAMPALA